MPVTKKCHGPPRSMLMAASVLTSVKLWMLVVARKSWNQLGLC
ncbi:unnamed protein product [Brassica oleracea]